MKRASILLILFLFACTSVTNDHGTVAGVVTDPNGNALPGVTVTLHTAAGDRNTVTDAHGAYKFTNVPDGTHRLQIALTGFGTRSVIVPVKDEKSPQVMTRLSNSVAESITVTAQASPKPRTDVFAGVAGRVVGGFTRTALNLPAEPPPDTAKYATIAENGFIDTAKERTTTFSIDVDGASYANVRRFLNANLIPPPDAVRIEEMVNYFTYSYPPPAGGRPFSVTTEAAGCPWDAGHRLLRIGVQAKNLDAWKLAPNHLVFLLDVSGSMQPPERLPLIKSAFRLLVDQLRPEDSVSIVVYAGAAGMVLPPTSGADKTAILGALDNLQAGGSTAGGAGIELAYKTAQENFAPGANNRVILATDGDFNVGTTGIDALTKLIEEKRKLGIDLTCIGVGTDNLNDALMESLADKGNGNYYYLDSIGEAKKVFVQQLQGTLVAVARDVKVQLEFDPARVASYRQIGYEDRALANKDFEDDTKDAGELGAGHSVTALYEIVPRGSGEIGTLRVRYKDPRGESSQLITTPVTDDGKSIYAASPDFQFAAAVAEFGMLLRNSKYKGTSSYADVLALARAMRGTDLEGYREEFLRMVETSRAITAPEGIARR